MPFASSYKLGCDRDDVPAPAETLLLGDIQRGQWPTTWRLLHLASANYLSIVHNGGGNYAFVDGHVKWMSAADLQGKERLFTIANN